MNPSVVIVGGGPAGCSAGRLLASWGHRVLLLNHARTAGASARSRTGLAESLPPTTRKLLAEIGVLDAVERAGFYRSTGNTVWWGSRDRRVESFDEASAAPGFQVHRPDFDRVLAREAARAGVEIRDARVRRVTLDDDEAVVEFERSSTIESVRCRFVLDCSGRAGVVARLFRRPGLRMYALVGEWQAESGWDVPDPTHTLVEAYDRGWAWSVPISPSVRHAGVMIDGRSPRRADGAGAGATRLEDAYRSELARASELANVLGATTLTRAWACEASTYSSDVYAGPNFLLVGDAASFIDPLSSYGVKKALASAWVAAVAVNTCLTDVDRQSCSLDFFSAREREMSTSHARRAREFAAAAAASYPHPFWTGRASAALEHEPSIDTARPDVRAALNGIRDSEAIDFALGDGVSFEPQPVIRGREIVLEDALSLPPHAGSALGPTVRFVDNVDLVALARLASRHRQVPDLFDAYCRTSGPAPLPRVLGGLSLLVATGVLRNRSEMRC